MKSKIGMAALGLAIALAAGNTWAAETVTYKGTGTFVAARVGLPLANGGVALHLSNDVVATIEPSEPGFIYGDCAGLGYLSAEGEYSVQAFCTFTESTDDAFDIKASLEMPAGGSVEIIGGSGKWSGATGSGKLKPKFNEGNRGSFTYEFDITTP